MNHVPKVGNAVILLQRFGNGRRPCRANGVAVQPVEASVGEGVWDGKVVGMPLEVQASSNGGKQNIRQMF